MHPEGDDAPQSNHSNFLRCVNTDTTAVKEKDNNDADSRVFEELPDISSLRSRFSAHQQTLSRPSPSSSPSSLQHPETSLSALDYGSVAPGSHPFQPSYQLLTPSQTPRTPAPESALCRLFRRASSEEFSASELRALRSLIVLTPPEQLSFVLPPSLFGKLVECNTSIASAVLIRLASSPDDALYFNQLLCQSSANPYYLLKCLRVVADVATSVDELPCYFLSRFISVACQTCASVRDFFPQQQVARLICVFLLELVQREKISTHDDIAYEIQTFAVTWVQLKEAGLLFRALRHLSSASSLSSFTESAPQSRRDLGLASSNRQCQGSPHVGAATP